MEIAKMNQEQKEVIETLQVYVPKLEAAILKVIDNIIKNKLNETISDVSNILEGLQWTYEAIWLFIQNEELRSDYSHLNNIQTELLECYETGDCILSKDILKYDIFPLFDRIYKSINEIKINF
jgi:hypothetical protein